MSQNPLFIPGPTNIPDRLRHAMDLQTINHRAPGFDANFIPLLEDLKEIFGTTEGRALLFPSTGTGGWETAVTNILSPGDEVLVARYGMFSHRWIELCRKHKLEVNQVTTEWGQGAPVAEFEAILAADTAHNIKAVLVTHNETATGVTSDIGAVHAVLKKLGHPALLMVDGVSSIASIEFRMDEWGVDVAVTGSQKGFMLMPGLSILALSPRALKACETATGCRAYFDILDMIEANRLGSFPYTPPTGLIRGLAESVVMLKEEGLQNVYARHARLAEGVRRAVAAWGLELCAKNPEEYSNTVTTVCVPEGFDAAELTKHCIAKYDVSFGGGLGDLAGKVFRIGHLGDITDVMLLSGIATAEMAMYDLGYPVELGSGVAAAQKYYSETAGQAKQQKVA